MASGQSFDGQKERWDRLAAAWFALDNKTQKRGLDARPFVNHHPFEEKFQLVETAGYGRGIRPIMQHSTIAKPLVNIAVESSY
jgi:hypothetical protein